MTNTPIILKHEMPFVWHLMCLVGALCCFTGLFTDRPALSIIGLFLTIPAIIWYLTSLRRLARRIEGR
jgi:hypothetical protein